MKKIIPIKTTTKAKGSFSTTFMTTPNNQIMMVPQRRSGKTEASIKLTEKLLRDTQLRTECVGKVRAFPSAPKTHTVVELNAAMQTKDSN